jgi:hypothetical protein
MEIKCRSNVKYPKWINTILIDWYIWRCSKVWRRTRGLPHDKWIRGIQNDINKINYNKK